MSATPADTSGPSMGFTAWVTILAPLLALALRLPTAGWGMVFFIYSSPLWLLGYVLLVVAVSRGMLRRRGVLRIGARRVRATIWAWLTTVGVLLFGLTMVDGAEVTESVQSTLTLWLGAPVTPSPAHAVSEALMLVAVVPWVVGWLALILEWAIGATRSKPEQPRVAPPVVAPPVA